MHITENGVVTALLKRTRKETRILHVSEGNTPEALEAKMNEVEVLRDDGRSRAREVEGEAVFDGTEVVQFEDQVLREMGLVPPDDPANADVGKTELVARRVDGDDTRQAEVPWKFRLDEQ